MSTSRNDFIPEFKLPASTGQSLERSSFRGKVPLVIVFLPSFDDAAARDQILDFDRLLSEFGAERAQVMAVVKETARRVREMADQLHLAMPVLADAGAEMARDFDAVEPDGTIRRVTVVADSDGRVVRRFDPAPADGQAEAILASLRAADTGHLEPEGATDERPD